MQAAQGDPRSPHRRTSLGTLPTVKEEFARWSGKHCHGAFCFLVVSGSAHHGGGPVPQAATPWGCGRRVLLPRGVARRGTPSGATNRTCGSKTTRLLCRPPISPHKYRLAQPTIDREGLAVQGPLALRRCTFSLLGLRRLALALLFAERISMAPAPCHQLPQGTCTPPFPARAPRK